MNKLYFSNRTFIVRQGNAFSPHFKIQAEVSQRSYLSPIVYNIFTIDIPNYDNILITSYVDDSTVLTIKLT